jgi:hypothetical protein
MKRIDGFYLERDGTRASQRKGKKISRSGSRRNPMKRPKTAKKSKENQAFCLISFAASLVKSNSG